MSAWKPTTEQVKALRERSGCGWIACRDTLIEAHGHSITGATDEDVALELLRVHRAAA